MPPKKSSFSRTFSVLYHKNAVCDETFSSPPCINLESGLDQSSLYRMTIHFVPTTLNTITGKTMKKRKVAKIPATARIRLIWSGGEHWCPERLLETERNRMRTMPPVEMRNSKLLCISTSKWVLCTPLASRNRLSDAKTTFSITNGMK